MLTTKKVGNNQLKSIVIRLDGYLKNNVTDMQHIKHRIELIRACSNETHLFNRIGLILVTLTDWLLYSSRDNRI